MATMKNINYWRDQVRKAEKALRAANENDLPIGAEVSYIQGKNEIVVKILEHTGYGILMRVRNVKTGREYLLEYSRIHRVIE